MTNLNTSTEAQNTTETAIGFIPCYRLPFLSLFHADCMEIMKQYPDKYFDLAIVDPPYGIDIDFSRYNKLNKIQRPKTEWDKEIPSEDYFKELFRVSKNQIIWGGEYFSLPTSTHWIAWDKRVTDAADKIYGGHFELAWATIGGHKMCRLQHAAARNADGNILRIHPTQKPERLYSWIIINYAKPNFKILDTHFGSGSIALAIDKANRLDKMNLHLTACEIDKEYIDKAIKRISESIKQGTLPF